MAFFAEMKRRKWYCVCGENMIRWYSKKLYDDWHKSLSPEQLERLELYRKRKEEARKRELEKSINNLAILSATMFGLTRRDKYGGLYNEDGTVNQSFFSDLN